jgi:hypothetical protein
VSRTVRRLRAYFSRARENVSSGRLSPSGTPISPLPDGSGLITDTRTPIAHGAGVPHSHDDKLANLSKSNPPRRAGSLPDPLWRAKYPTTRGRTVNSELFGFSRPRPAGLGPPCRTRIALLSRLPHRDTMPPGGKVTYVCSLPMGAKELYHIFSDSQAPNA